VDTDAQAAVRADLDGEGIIDFGGMRVVDGEGLDCRKRQITKLYRCFMCGEVGAVREVLEQEAAKLVVVGTADRAALLQQCRNREPRLGAGRFQRLGFDAVAVRLVQQRLQQGFELGRQAAGLEFFDHALAQQCLLAFLLLTGERGAQDFWWRLAKAALALAMEIHRRRMQAQQQRSGFDGVGFVPVVVGGQLFETEFVVGAGFPEKVGVYTAAGFVGTFHQLGRGRLDEAQQYIRALDLGALAGRQLDLQRGVVVGKDLAGLETAVFFKQDVHQTRGGEAAAGTGRGPKCQVSSTTMPKTMRYQAKGTKSWLEM
jgi:hypothetical protein